MVKTNEEGACVYCGTMYYELRSEGSPCGYISHPTGKYGCTTFTCCNKSWRDHMLKYHSIDVDSEEWKEQQKTEVFKNETSEDNPYKASS